MADVKAAEISAILKQQLSGFEATASLDEVGTVLTVGDGIVRAYGLSNAQYGELVQFDGGLEGIVLNLEEDNVGIVLLGASKVVREGSTGYCSTSQTQLDKVHVQTYEFLQILKRYKHQFDHL